MSRREKLKCYRKLEEIVRHFRPEGKKLLWHMVHDLEIHEFDAVEIILEQHQNLVYPTVGAYL